MDLLNLIKIWPDFLQHIIIKKITPFSTIINLSKTCKELNQLIKKSFKSYDLLCISKNYLNHPYFKQPSLFYTNEHEWKIFNDIFSYYKYKYHINDAITSENLIYVEWRLKNKMIPNYFQ